MDRLKQVDKGFLPGLIRRHTPSSLHKKPSDSNTQKPMLDIIPDHIRNHAIAMAGELVGTGAFLFFAFSGTQVANTPTTTVNPDTIDIPQGPNPSALLYVSLAFGFSLAVNAWVFYRVSGGLFNPAVGDCLP
jgi:hypothetical protein